MPEVAANGVASPEYFYDFDTRQVVLLGSVALGDLISIHPYIEVLVDKNKVDIRNEDSEVILPTLHDLITVAGAIPPDFEKMKNEFENISLEDCLDYGRWLIAISNRSEKALPVTYINRAGHLGIGPSGHMIRDPKRFGKMTNFQTQLGQRGIRWRSEYENLSDWEIAHRLHEIGIEEGCRPSIPILERRLAEGKKEISPKFIRTRMSLYKAYERAGYLYPRSWDKWKHLEWVYMFIGENRKVPSERELEILSARGRGPSSTGIYDVFGNLKHYQTLARRYRAKRKSIKLGCIEHDIQLGKLPAAIKKDSVDSDDLIKRSSRYHVVASLLEKETSAHNLEFAKMDLVGASLVEEFKILGHDIPQWMAEAAAWEFNCVPELFPEGDLIKSLKID